MNIDEIGTEFIKNLYSSRDLRLAHPIFLKVFPELRTEFGLLTGMELGISCVYRSPKAQNDVFSSGRTKPGKILTYHDGINTLSKHNMFPSEAIDTFVMYAGKCIWTPEVFKPLIELAPKYGLISGGSWAKFKDYPHLQIADKESIK